MLEYVIGLLLISLIESCMINIAGVPRRRTEEERHLLRRHQARLARSQARPPQRGLGLRTHGD